jgi:hypothetical protein
VPGVLAHPVGEIGEVGQVLFRGSSFPV